MCYITGFVTRLTRRVSIVEQGLFTLTCVQLQFLVGLILLDLWFYMYCLCIVVCPFVLFLFSVLLLYTDSDYLLHFFGIFKLLLHLSLFHIYVAQNLKIICYVQCIYICNIVSNRQSIMTIVIRKPMDVHEGPG